MTKRFSDLRPNSWSRRAFLEGLGGGLGSVAVAAMLSAEGLFASDPGSAGGLHHRPRAKRVIQLFMNGGVSQMDSFDYKPELQKRHGEKIDFGVKTAVTSDPGPVMKSPFEWKRHGESGRWVSNVFPHLAGFVDEMAFLMAMRSRTNVHGPASYLQNTGFLNPGFPCMGAWISYALGNMNDDLPTFVVLPDTRGLPYNNRGNFSPGFLSPEHQGIIVKPESAHPIANLSLPGFARHISPDADKAGLSLLERLNRAHARKHPDDPRLEARIESFELAARMQLSAPDALDLSSETESMKQRYGLNDKHTAGFGRNCLTARRLIERGVRVVQVWSGTGGNQKNWDNHTDIHKELPYIASQVDLPIAGLLADLKERGLLESTLVVWTTEFGRMPFTQGATGRDHNGSTSVSWLAGAGIRGGSSHGRSDDFSFRAADGTTYGYDLNATILHLLGIDHELLTVSHNGFDRRLTDVHGHVIHEILA